MNTSEKCYEIAIDPHVYAADLHSYKYGKILTSVFLRAAKVELSRSTQVCLLCEGVRPSVYHTDTGLNDAPDVTSVPYFTALALLTRLVTKVSYFNCAV